MNMPWFESPFFEPLLAEQQLKPDQISLLREFAEKGYVVLDAVIPEGSEIPQRIINDLSPRYRGRGRIQDAWKFQQDVRSIAVQERILSTLRLLYQRDPIPFQTLNFPVGTEQSTHSDTVHFHSVPHRFMCGVWVALEDIMGESGPLHVYPGSHKLPVWNFHDLGLPSGVEHYHVYEDGIQKYIETLGLKKHIVLLRKGQALIWAANVLHGGEPIRDPSRTRHSQVTHYYFSDCLYYTPMLSDPYIGKIYMRSIVDIRTGKAVPNRYNGQDLSQPSSASATMAVNRPASRNIARRIVNKLRRMAS